MTVDVAILDERQKRTQEQLGQMHQAAGRMWEAHGALSNRTTAVEQRVDAGEETTRRIEAKVDQGFEKISTQFNQLVLTGIGIIGGLIAVAAAIASGG